MKYQYIKCSPNNNFFGQMLNHHNKQLYWSIYMYTSMVEDIDKHNLINQLLMTILYI